MEGLLLASYVPLLEQGQGTAVKAARLARTFTPQL